MRTLVLTCLSCSLVAATSDDAQLLTHGASSTGDLRWSLGLNTGLDTLTLKFSDTRLERQLDAQTGISAAVEWAQSHLRWGGNGWVWAVGAQADWLRGEDSDGLVHLGTGGFTGRIAWMGRWDNTTDALSTFRYWQWEFGPVVAAGAAQAHAEDFGTSDLGYFLAYGLRFDLLRGSGEAWQWQGSAGYLVRTAWVDWDNTDGSTAEASGLELRFGFGNRF